MVVLIQIELIVLHFNMIFVHWCIRSWKRW